MRLFIGIGLPLSVGEALQRAALTLLPPTTQPDKGPRIRRTRPHNMHVTVSFLGSVEPSRVDQIQHSLAAIHARPLHLQLNGPGTFAHAGILHAAVKPSPNLLSFAQQVFQAMENCGFPREQRPYSPHVTLARANGVIRLPSRPFTDPAFREAFDAHEFRLYQSFTRPEGSEYEILRAFPLA